MAREDGRDKVILPVWHNIGVGEIIKSSPLLADKLSVSTQNGIAYTADKIAEAVLNSQINHDLTQPNFGPTKEEILQRLGHQMLMASSSWELRRTLYELEEFMVLYPHSPDARILKHRIEEGMRRAERMEALPKAAPLPGIEVGLADSRRPSMVLRIIIWLLIIASVGALLLRWLG